LDNSPSKKDKNLSELKIVLVRFDSNSPQSLALKLNLKLNLFIYLFIHA
jgi:hypothetical protein